MSNSVMKSMMACTNVTALKDMSWIKMDTAVKVIYRDAFIHTYTYVQYIIYYIIDMYVEIVYYLSILVSTLFFIISMILSIHKIQW